MMIIDKGDLTFDREEKFYTCLSTFFFLTSLIAIIIGAAI
jgi:hypothetical protein